MYVFSRCYTCQMKDVGQKSEVVTILTVQEANLEYEITNHSRMTVRVKE